MQTVSYPDALAVHRARKRPFGAIVGGATG